MQDLVSQTEGLHIYPLHDGRPLEDLKQESGMIRFRFRSDLTAVWDMNKRDTIMGWQKEESVSYCSGPDKTRQHALVSGQGVGYRM